MFYPPYNPPVFLQQGLAMTLYTSLWVGRHWQRTLTLPDPPYQEVVFTGAEQTPLFGWMAAPQNPDHCRGTIVGTYGITGDLKNQWLLQILGRKAFAQGYAVVLFDWRAHGKSAELSPTLTSDGLYEGEDYVRIAAIAKQLGCPPPFWFTGFSLSGQMALWGIKAGQDLLGSGMTDLGLQAADIGGAAVICPNLDSQRSLTYLVSSRAGRLVEQAIARELKKLAWQIHQRHPHAIDAAAIERANSIWGFDHELVIQKLGFSSVEEYYAATSGLQLLPILQKPVLIIYAEDDPLFAPSIIPDLAAACGQNRAIDLLLTQHGGHGCYLSSARGQRQSGDPDPWWAWNRVLDWCDQQTSVAAIPVS